MKKTITIDVSDFKYNNFHFLRFVAASLVIFDHAFPLFGYPISSYLLLLKLFGALSLPTFFVISGFLITKSWLDTPNLFIYFKKRCLRIIPALAAATFFCAFIIGPMTTTLSLRAYFTNSQTWHYLLNILLLTKYPLPGVFENNPYFGVNGSLWSLPYEFWMYIFIAALGIIGILSKRGRFLIFFLCLLTIVVAELFRENLLSPNMRFLFIYSAPLFVNFGTYFVVGSLFYLYREKIVLDGRLMIIALTIFVISIKFPVLESLQYISLPYMITYFAFSINNRFLKNFGKYGDFSYGMYVFAFPIQQTLVYYFGKKISFLNFNILSFLIALIFAFISWNLIEKQALKLKKTNLKSLLLSFKKHRLAKKRLAV